jgi:hypothetical protein
MFCRAIEPSYGDLATEPVERPDETAQLSACSRRQAVAGDEAEPIRGCNIPRIGKSRRGPLMLTLTYTLSTGKNVWGRSHCLMWNRRLDCFRGKA